MFIKGFWHEQDPEFNQLQKVKKKIKKKNTQKRVNLHKKGGSSYTKTEHTTLKDEIKALNYRPKENQKSTHSWGHDVLQECSKIIGKALKFR